MPTPHDVDRCPTCGAAATPGVDWCTLCYWRPPPPEPEQPLVPEPAPDPTPPTRVVPAARAEAVAAATAVTGAAPRRAAPAPAGADVPTWPCSACGAAVPLEDAACACGTPFLAGAALRTPVPVPGVGDLTTLSRGRRLALGAVAALVAAALFLALLTVLGAVL